MSILVAAPGTRENTSFQRWRDISYQDGFWQIFYSLATPPEMKVREEYWTQFGRRFLAIKREIVENQIGVQYEKFLLEECIIPEEGDDVWDLPLPELEPILYPPERETIQEWIGVDYYFKEFFKDG